MKKVVKIEGMMCQHCAAHVKQALEAVGAGEVQVDLAGKCAVLADTTVADDVLCAAVAGAGYDVTGIETA